MRKNMHRLVLAGCLGAAASLAGLTGCSSPDRSSGQLMDDMMISRRVSGALNDSPIYKFNDVDVKSYNGSVQLSGWAVSQEQKAKAADIAKNVRGVREVINNISLKTEAGLDPRTGRPTAQGSAGANVQVEQNRQQSTTTSERQQQEQQDLQRRQQELQQQQRQLEQQRQEQLRREQVTP